MFDPLTVRSYRGDYVVRFVEQVLPVLRETVRDRDVIFLDKRVGGLYPELAEFTQTRRCRTIDPTEEAKTFQSLAPLLESLITDNFTKTDRLIAIGGGITQDIAAFTASILYRGVPWIFFPTNLLSQCDSCIGSKTSIFRRLQKHAGRILSPPGNLYCLLPAGDAKRPRDSFGTGG
jgi:3-dehydroquinate synthase